MKETVTDPFLFFHLSIIFGMILFVLYDLIRGIRRVFIHKMLCVVVEDIVYGISVAVISFRFLCTYNYGELRGFFFLGIWIGMILYYKILSPKILLFLSYIFSNIYIIFKNIYNICINPIIHIKRNLRWRLKKEKKQVTMALKKQRKRGG